MASVRPTIPTILSESGPRARMATCWYPLARLISVSPTRSSFRSTALSAATPWSASARCAKWCMRPIGAWCSKSRSRVCSARHGTNQASPCAFRASIGYAGTSRPARPTGWKHSNECWKRSRPAAARPSRRVKVIGCCHEHADGAADGQQFPQSVLWWAASVGHLPADPAVDFDRRDPGGARARSLEHYRKPETAHAAHLGHGLRRGTLGLALSPPRRRRGGADLVGRAPHARGQGPVIALPRRADCGDFERTWTTWTKWRNRTLCRPLLRRHGGSVRADKLVDSRVPNATQRFRQLRLDGRDESQPMKHERAVELDQGRTRSDLRNSRLARVDAAHADEWKRTLDPHIGLRQHTRREREQRAPRQTPCFPGRRLIAQRHRPRQRGVADNHSVDAVPARRSDDVIELAEREIGRNLDQQGRWSRHSAHAHARVHHARQKTVEHLRLLQLAQAWSIGRGDIDGEVARHRRKGFDQAHIVSNAVSTFPVGPDINPDDATFVCARGKTAQHGGGALTVEAQAIDHALVAVEPKDARARIAGLRQGRDGSNFDEAKTELEQRVGYLGMLVEARCHAHWIGEIEPEGTHGEPGVVRDQLGEWRKSQRVDGNPMGVLRVEHAQHRPRKRHEQADHGISSGKTCCWSIPRGSGLTHNTAARGRPP